MANNQKIHASTQKFTEVVDIVDNIVLLQGGAACLIVEVTASNFALLSQKEQDSKIYSYAALLNSLTFPVQILIRNKRIDVSSYLKTLEEAEMKTTNELLQRQIRLYREFVREMVKINVVLSKSFYMVIPYSPLEAGVGNMTQTNGKTHPDTPIQAARKSLLSKAEALQGQIRRLAVAARVLEKEELIKLFYSIYNDDDSEVGDTEYDTDSPLVKGVV